MGSRNSWAAELAKRCEDVGWEVTWGPGGHRRIKTHKGKVFSLASSTSDRHGQKNAERACIRHGLEELERRKALLEAKERLERLEEDRKNGVDWEAEDKKREEEKMKANTEGHLGYVDGIAIDTIAPAMYKVKRPNEVRRPVPNVQELLLVDGTIKFRCDMDSDTGPCHKTANSVQGVSMHQARTHTGKYQLKDKIVSDNVQRAVDKAKSTEKVVTVDKRGTVVKVEDYAEHEAQAQKIIDSGAMEAFPIEEIKSAKITTTRIDAVVASVQLHDDPGEPVMPGIFVRIIRLAEEFDELVNEAVTLTESVRVKRDELRKLITELPDHIMTVEVKEKLETYEQLKSMLK